MVEGKYIGLTFATASSIAIGTNTVVVEVFDSEHVLLADSDLDGDGIVERRKGAWQSTLDPEPQYLLPMFCPVANFAAYAFAQLSSLPRSVSSAPVWVIHFLATFFIAFDIFSGPYLHRF